MSEPRKIIEVQQLALAFGGIKALDGVSLAVPSGSIYAIVGPNGSGKTSLLNAVNGLYRPSSGNVLLDGADITSLPAHRIARAGVGRTFQNLELFPEMTVLENILVGCHKEMRANIFAAGLFWRFAQKEEVALRRKAEEVIDFLELERYRKSIAGGLPYGVQKLVGLGRALAMQPKVVLMDEPSSGMTRQEKEDLARFLLRIKYELGLTLVWVEHDMNLVADIADCVAVLHYGQLIAEGSPEDALSHPLVVEAYLGQDGSVRGALADGSVTGSRG